MKRLLHLLILLLVLTLALTACSKDSGSSDGSSDTSTDTGSTNTDTGTGTSTDTGANTNTSTSTDTNTNTNTGTNTNPQSCTHQFGDWSEIRPSTCTVKGFYERFCIYCNLRTTRLEDALGHTEVTDPASAPTCIQSGYTEGKHCTTCGEVTVPQTEITDSSAHNFTELVSVSSTPTLSSSGSAKFKCEYCQKTGTVSLPKLTKETLTKNDIYSVTTDKYNPAIDNVWKVFDGNKNSAGIYSTGDDWFGNVGDKLVITLEQEVVLTDLKMYVAGNWTYADVSVRDASGKRTAWVEVKANGSAYGGQGVCMNVVSGKSIKAYTIEIEITQIKESYLTFKVAELEIVAAKPDTRLPHTHVYREYVKDTVAATCSTKGKASYACYCGAQEERETPIREHSYDNLVSSVPATCTVNGKEIYACECSLTIEKTLTAPGHKYEKLVNYTAVPTKSSTGKANYKCIGCELTTQKTIDALPLEYIRYLRVASIENGTVTLNFNINDERSNYEVRFSTSPITESNFSSATKISATVTQDSSGYEITAKINLNASLTNGYYVAIRPYNGTNYGQVACIRVGGDLQLPIDYSDSRVYSGEVLNSFASLFDEQGKYNGSGQTPSTALGQIFNDSSKTELYGMNLSPIIDLEYMHYVSKVSLYYASSGYSVKVRWSSTPVDFMAQDSEWDGCAQITTQVGYNDVTVGANARYVQIVFKDGQAPCEVFLYGYQSGNGDKIATTQKELPTLGEMMGMCGFTAIGGGNTPVDSVICTTVLREYHKLEWSYSLNNYPNQAAFFSGGMGNFDDKYREYTMAGINVVPCIQWAVESTSLSNKVNANGTPVKSGGSLVRGGFYDKLDPNTYFVYADAMFAFSARYGSNSSSLLLQAAAPHVSGEAKVGLGYIEWIELGNEPDGSWNGIDNYYSAYQLAALTSAGYDGHCSTMVSPSSAGYHLGLKNADPNMKGAMAGVSGISNEYIMAMCYWMQANRADGKVAVDAFNVHHYMSKQIEIEGNKLYVGISPEEANLVGILSQLIEIRDKYYPEKEVWITEFGWDTNQSYATVNSSHAYAEYTGRQVQAMWLTRAYLLLSACGVDKATMYMCEDVGTVENEAVGKFATSGVIGYEYDEYGNVVEFKKDSYYYLYTLKSTLGDFTFNREIEAYDENVMIYEYVSASGKTAYAAWCKTSDGTKSLNYQLKIDGNSATLTEAVYGDTDGVQTRLVSDSLGYVSIDISENPVYVVVE